MWSCSPSRSIPWTPPGAISAPATSRPPAASAPHTTSCGWWISSTRPASASSWTGCPPTSPRMLTACTSLTGSPATSMPTPGRGSTPTGAPGCLTTGEARCGPSSTPPPCSGWSSTTSTAFGWMRWPPCSTWTTAGRTASGCPTYSAGTRIWRPLNSSSSSIPTFSAPTAT